MKLWQAALLSACLIVVVSAVIMVPVLLSRIPDWRVGGGIFVGLVWIVVTLLLWRCEDKGGY